MIKFYNADITLFGNTHFAPGDHFWLEPKNYPPSANMRRNLINRKIIHPYEALQVVNEISQNDFTTTIEQSAYISANNEHSQVNERRQEAQARREEFRERESEINNERVREQAQQLSEEIENQVRTALSDVAALQSTTTETSRTDDVIRRTVTLSPRLITPEARRRELARIRASRLGGASPAIRERLSQTLQEITSASTRLSALESSVAQDHPTTEATSTQLQAARSDINAHLEAINSRISELPQPEEE